MRFTYLVFVGQSGTACPIGIYDEGWIKRDKQVKEVKNGFVVRVLADGIGEAMIKAKEIVRGGQCGNICKAD